MTHEKSSYYTGYEGLDESLSALYTRQSMQEHDGKDTSHTIRLQDIYLLIGKKRDEHKEVY